MKTPLRVHICPVGFEVRRVTEPLVSMRADKAYLVSYRRDDEAATYLAKVKSVLHHEYKQIQVTEEFLDLWDLLACIGRFKQIVRNEKEEGNLVYINVSTATKVTAIAGTIVSMLLGSTPYYAKVNYGPRQLSTPPTEKVDEPFEIPVYQILTPRPEALKILEIIEKEKGTIKKKDLIAKLREIGMIRSIASSDLSLQAAHGQLKSHLNPLEREWRFITVESRGRSSTVKLTDLGRTALRVFL
jgi:hypothetical protein